MPCCPTGEAVPTLGHGGEGWLRTDCLGRGFKPLQALEDSSCPPAAPGSPCPAPRSWDSYPDTPRDTAASTPKSSLLRPLTNSACRSPSQRSGHPLQLSRRPHSWAHRPGSLLASRRLMSSHRSNGSIHSDCLNEKTSQDGFRDFNCAGNLSGWNPGA